MKIVRLSPPAEIIPISLISEYIGLDGDLDASQNAVLLALRQASIEFGEEITGLVWAEADYQIEMESGFFGAFCLPVAPVMSVNSISYVDGSGSEVVLPESSYSFTPANMEFFAPWATIVKTDEWPADARQIKVVCTAGWSAASLPESLRVWSLVRIATLFDVRDDVVIGTISASIPRDHARALLDRYTVRNNPYVFG